MKKLLGFVFLCILIMVIPLNSLGLEGVNQSSRPDHLPTYTDQNGSWFYKKLDDGTIELIGCWVDWDVDEIFIPEEIKGQRVTCIDGETLWWNWPPQIYSSVLTIPKDLVTIKGNPFYSLGSAPWIIKFEIAQDHPTLEVRDGCLIDKTEKRLIAASCEYYDSIPEGVEIVGKYSLISPEGLVIPESVTTLEHGCFTENTASKLKTVVIPKTVTKLKGNPFSNHRYIPIALEKDHPTLEIVDNVLYDKTDHRLICAAIEQNKIVVQPGTEIIEEEAFSYYWQVRSKLTSVTLPDGVKHIGRLAFYDSGLSKINLPDSIESIGEACFSGSKIKSVTIPNGITSIGEETFTGCKQLQDVTLPDSITSIGRFAFYGCSALKKITVPGSVSTIEEFVFGRCSKLNSVVFEEGVTRIEAYNFEDCPNLRTITFPKSMKSISASFDNKKVKAVVFKGSRAEHYCKLNKIKYSYADEK